MEKGMLGPKFEIEYWIKCLEQLQDGVILDSQSGRVFVDFGQTLFFMHLKAEDSGKYSCHVNHPYLGQTIVKSVNLIVDAR